MFGRNLKQRFMGRPTHISWLPLGGKCFTLLIFLIVPRASEEIGPHQNFLRFGYGVNFKSNGLLHHNLDRVWVVHRISLPSVDEVDRLPNFPKALECNLQHSPQVKRPNMGRAQYVDTLCEATVPYLKLLYSQSEFYKKEIIRLIKQDLHMALHGLTAVGKIRYKRALTRWHVMSEFRNRHNLSRITALTNNRMVEPHEQVQASLSDLPKVLASPLNSEEDHFLDPPDPQVMNRTSRAVPGMGMLVGSLVTQGVGALITLAKESISAHLSRKRSKAIARAMSQMDSNNEKTKNQLQLLEKDFLMYGDYDINSTASIVSMLKYLGNRTSSIERWVKLKEPSWSYHYMDQTHGPAMYAHHLHIYLNSVKEKYIRLYQRLENDLKMVIRSIGILSKGYLPPHLFPPSLLANISSSAIKMVKSNNPDYVLATEHVLDYYDMPLVTFGRDEADRLVVCFPIYIREYHKLPLRLYQIETVKVPIEDENKAADSYSEVRISKPYIAANPNRYIQLVQAELRMCKSIRNTYYCEELFLTKHSTHRSCESCLFYNRTHDEIMANCDFDYYYNISVMPSVLDGGNEIVLANFKDRKVLACPHRPAHTQPLPKSTYTKVPRGILCYCELRAGLTSLDKTVTSCNASQVPVLEYTMNLGFWDLFKVFLDPAFANLSLAPSPYPVVFPVSLEDYSKDKDFPIYCQDSSPLPSTLKQLSHIAYQKKLFLENRHKFVLKTKGRYGDKVRLPSENSFLFSAIFHMYLAIGSSLAILHILSCLILACKQRKLGMAIGAISLMQHRAVEAVETVPHSQRLVTLEQAEKMFCHNQWMTYTVTGITLLGVAVYALREYKPWQLIRGFRNPLLCEIYLCFKNETHFVPVKVGEFEGSPTGLQVFRIIEPWQVKLLKGHLLEWDHLQINYVDTKVVHDKNPLQLKSLVAIPFKDKYRFRKMYTKQYTCAFMATQNGIRYIITEGDCRHCLMDISASEDEAASPNEEV